jgi:hypothetical protein
LLVVFALTAYAGVNILEYFMLTNRIWFGSRGQPLADVLEEVSPWQNTSSVAALMRSLTLELIQTETPNDAAALESALEDMAAVTPTSTSAWLALAAIRKARGASMDDVVAALRMSALTGSHEGFFAKRRALFGLAHWNEMPQAGREIIVRDMITSITPEDVDPASRYRRILTAKPEAERAEINAAILKSGRASSYVLGALGI